MWKLIEQKMKNPLQVYIEWRNMLQIILETKTDVKLKKMAKLEYTAMQKLEFIWTVIYL